MRHLCHRHKGAPLAPLLDPYHVSRPTPPRNARQLHHSSPASLYGPKPAIPRTMTANRIDPIIATSGPSRRIDPSPPTSSAPTLPQPPPQSIPKIPHVTLTPSTDPPDRLTLHDLSLSFPPGVIPSAFGVEPSLSAPGRLTAVLYLKPEVVMSCVKADDWSGLTVNYVDIASSIQSGLSVMQSTTISAIFEALASPILSNANISSAHLNLTLPKALTLVSDVTYSAIVTRPSRSMCTAIDASKFGTSIPTTRPRRSVGMSEMIAQSKSGVTVSETIAPRLEVRNLHFRMKVNAGVVLGLHDFEKRERQGVELELVLRGAEGWVHRELQNAAVEVGLGPEDCLLQFLENTSFSTVEALLDTLAHHLLTDLSPSSILTLTLAKPHGLQFGHPSFSISRSQSSYAAREAPSRIPWTHAASSKTSGPSSSRRTVVSPLERGGEGRDRVFVSVGSNVGDRVGAIREALRLLDVEEGVRVVGTSRLYESEPMYVEDQPKFINGVIEVSELGFHLYLTLLDDYTRYSVDTVLG